MSSSSEDWDDILSDLLSSSSEEDSEVVRQWINSSEGSKAIKKVENRNKPKKRRRKEKVKNRAYYEQTPWWKVIHHPEIKDPCSKLARLFRRRFRLPFSLFTSLLDLCKQREVFETKGDPQHRHYMIPQEIKLLLCLRIMGRDEVFDTVSELCGVSEDMCRTILFNFTEKFRALFQSEYIGVRDAHDLAQIMDVYAKLGN
jgi:hypothetical protein